MCLPPDGQALLVYDITNRRSFDALDSWLKESAKFGAKDLVVVVCANKSDLSNVGGDGSRAVSEAEGSRWAAARGFP